MCVKRGNEEDPHVCIHKQGVQKPASAEEEAALVARVLAERAAYARYKQQLLASTAALGTALTGLTFALYSKVGDLSPLSVKLAQCNDCSRCGIFCPCEMTQGAEWFMHPDILSSSQRHLQSSAGSPSADTLSASVMLQLEVKDARCRLQDVGASFAVGAVGSVAYLHLLNKSIDGLGGASDLVPEVHPGLSV
jgi:hypothetical protein